MKLLEQLHLRVDAFEVGLADGRVLVFQIPSRPIGVPLAYKNTYWMRSGESMVAMPAQHLKRIFDEAQPDYSARICPGASLAELSGEAIAEFRRRWAQKAKRPDLLDLSNDRILRDAEVLSNEGITYAALLLFGTAEGLLQHLAQAEVVFEYRHTEGLVAHDQRREYRLGLFGFFDDLWRQIDLRNDRHSVQNGLFREEIPAFNEEAVREVVLNAVAHRDYQLPGSVFVRQWPTRLMVTSPGGFPPGISPDNIIFRQSPRNRRVAEVLQRCGLVERSGQGADRMFAASIREGKLPPGFAGTDAYQVAVTLHGQVQDEGFLKALHRLSEEQGALLRVEDLLVIDAVHRKQPVAEQLRGRLDDLVTQGILERVGRGRGARFILARRFSALAGRTGRYTRERGLDRDTNKQLLLKHIKDQAKVGSQLKELSEVLPGLSKAQVQTLLREMKKAGAVHSVGTTRSGRWYPGRLKPDGAQ